MLGQELAGWLIGELIGASVMAGGTKSSMHSEAYTRCCKSNCGIKKMFSVFLCDLLIFSEHQQYFECSSKRIGSGNTQYLVAWEFVGLISTLMPGNWESKTFRIIVTGSKVVRLTCEQA